MNEADAALAKFASRARSLSKLGQTAAQEAEPRIAEAVKATAAAGLDAVDGTPWPAKRDGTRALPNAASAVVTSVVGSVVRVLLKGAYVFHQRASDDGFRRRVIPDGGAGVPARMAAIAREASRRAFESLMGA